MEGYRNFSLRGFSQNSKIIFEYRVIYKFVFFYDDCFIIYIYIYKKHLDKFMVLSTTTFTGVIISRNFPSTLYKKNTHLYIYLLYYKY